MRKLSHTFLAITLLTAPTICSDTTPEQKPLTLEEEREARKEESKASTQAAVAGFMGLVTNIINIITNHDNPSAVSSGAHGIISSILSIIAATKHDQATNIDLQIELLEKLQEELLKELATKKKALSDENV